MSKSEWKFLDCMECYANSMKDYDKRKDAFKLCEHCEKEIDLLRGLAKKEKYEYKYSYTKE